MKCWPKGTSGQRILIQQDNARSHVAIDDAQLNLEFDKLREHGWDISMTCQPPNSPDTTICDFGFFSSLQGLQQQYRMRRLVDIVTAVNSAFADYPWSSLERSFQALQEYFVETIKINGNNSYKLPHMSKVKRAKQGRIRQAPMEV